MKCIMSDFLRLLSVLMDSPQNNSLMMVRDVKVDDASVLCYFSSILFK